MILAVALVIRIWGTWFGQPYVLHPDEHLIVQQALEMLKAPGYDLNPHFFDYPSLYIYVTALFYSIMGLLLYAGGTIASFAQFYDYAAQNLFYFHFLGRIMTAMMGAATVYLTYLAARRLLGTTTALLVAWFLTFAFVHFTDSHFLSTDVPSAFLVMLAFYRCLTALHTERLRFLYSAGFVSGLAASTKYPAGLVLLTVFSAYLQLAGAAGISWRRAIFSGRSMNILLRAAAGFLLGTPFAILDFKGFAGGLSSQFLHSKSGHLGVTESGFFGYFTSVIPCGGVGVVLMAAAVAGMLFSLWLKPRGRYWLLFSFPFFFYLLLGNSALKVDRYLIPVIPFWCIYAGIFAARVSVSLASFPWPRRMIAATLALLLAAPSLYYAGKWCWLAVQPDTRVQAAEWMQTHIPRKTSIAMRAGSWMLPPVAPDRYNITQMDLMTEESTRQRLSLKLAMLDNPTSAWILQNAFNYRPDAAVRDSLRVTLRRMPDFSTWRARPLAYYREQDVHYVITSSLLQQRFFDAATIAKYPEMAKSWQKFYGELEKEGRLVKDFAPPAAHKHEWGMGFLESPTICIYDLHAKD
jgi:4-amino-4-deoxy-L-arabinose transferase-like glycosyltransferase